MGAKKISLLVVGILLFIILLQNTQVVTIQLLFWQINMSRIILLLLTMLVGFILGYFVCHGKVK